MRSLRFIFLSVLLVMSAMTSGAQIRIVSREALDAVASPRLSKDSSSLDFDVRHIVAAPMKNDESPATFKVEMTNIGEDTLDILRLQTSCSCVSATAAQKKLAPGTKTVLTVRYDPKGHLGRFEHKIFVYTTPGNAPSAVLRLSVDVEDGSDISGTYQERMGKIALRSRNIAFIKNRKAVEVLKFVNLSGKDLKLECEDMFLPDCISFESRPKVTGPGQEGEIVITYDPSSGPSPDRAKLILKNLGVQPSQSTINITIE